MVFKMKCRRFLPLICFSWLVASLPAIAGSAYVGNSQSRRVITNGKAETRLNVREVYNGEREADAFAVKRERGKTSITYVEDGRNVQEDTYFDVTSRSYSREQGTVLKNTTVRVQESYEFTGFQESHRVTAGFDF
ncbi:hypothetical protein C1752_04108 [Acaryochloris thomasi RCC1774]|uniref:Uncharacterized protein n=1 Tax=Acaryochloris thomasi RCC1774 TaxID=1764569 RepID=A0A2W1JEC4_9CYAN|nr:hypothetical protein C1752_04108 [Acaryochloris thomasi RCC1774]